jgi:hypothetical protein
MRRVLNLDVVENRHGLILERKKKKEIKSTDHNYVDVDINNRQDPGNIFGTSKIDKIDFGFLNVSSRREFRLISTWRSSFSR